MNHFAFSNRDGMSRRRHAISGQIGKIGPPALYAIEKCGMRQQPSPLTFNDVIHLFRLCGHLQRHLDRGFDDHHGLSFEEVQVLWQIQSNQGECRQSTATGIDEDVVLRVEAKKHVANLRKLGLIEDDIDSHWRDNRRKPLRLTDKGASVLGEFQETWSLIAKDASFASLPQDALHKLSDSLRDLLQAPEVVKRAFKRSDRPYME